MESAFDRFVAFFALLFLLPLFLVIALAVVFGSRGGAFYVQQRVGRGGKLFGMFKFRSMRPFADKAGKLTIGHRDPRVTRVGYTLRKYKVDELPQLINVLIGDMSIVGPRPEVPDYVAMYNAEQRKVLDVKPGITDYASLQYFHESELLAKSADPQRTYIEEVMPAKLKLNLAYIKRRSLAEDLKIMGLTLVRIFK
jgi:lipopolysaccharide/colanic/teichoic acid biosynthesis glycosyltransferase